VKRKEKKPLRPPGFGNMHGPIKQANLSIPSQLMLLVWSPVYAMRILMHSLLYSTMSSKLVIFFAPSSMASCSFLVF